MGIARNSASVLLAAAAMQLLAAAAAGKDNPDSGLIDASTVRAHMEFLASDALNGRGSGSRDEWIAATYIAATSCAAAACSRSATQGDFGSKPFRSIVPRSSRSPPCCTSSAGRGHSRHANLGDAIECRPPITARCRITVPVWRRRAAERDPLSAHTRGCGTGQSVGAAVRRPRAVARRGRNRRRGAHLERFIGTSAIADRRAPTILQLPPSPASTVPPRISIC